MTADISQSTTKTFNYSFPTCTNEEVLFKLEVPVEIPYAGSTRELVQRVINMFHIPVYLQDELNENLATFVSEETKNFHNDRDQTLLDQLKSSEINVEGIIKGWEKAFKENVMEYAEQKGTSDEEVFAAAYHKLVHSPALETILQVENAYAKTVMNTLMDRDEDIRQLTQKQTEEMEEKVRLLNNNAATEMEINELATQQFEQQALVAGRWGSQLDAERQTQRALHRAWLMNTLEDLQSSSALHTPSNSPLGTFSPMTSVPAPLGPPGGSGARLEESFTIHLGSQLKQTHNIRLVTMDILDMCNVEDFDNPTDSWRRLQTSLGLYSAELSGAVLLTESPPRRPAPPTSGVIAAANRTTEHHFADVEHQLREIAEKIAEPVERRNALRAGESAGVAGGAGGAGGARRVRSVRGADPQAGDVFVTRHSNLPDLHAVFHLVVDESSLRSGDITSRHPAILGLRNILKAACSHDVTSLTIPLLLCHDIDDMTAGWCVRRAELVLKCAKGFMLEGAASRGAALRTLHVAAPRHTAPALFAQLAALLPDIFRQASPVKYKPPANSG